MPEDPATEAFDRVVASTAPHAPVEEDETAPSDPEAMKRRTDVMAAGHRGDAPVARQGLDDPNDKVRAAALGALLRAGAATVADVLAAFRDQSAVVRRRAAEVAVTVSGPGSRSVLVDGLIAALADDDALVVVNACWALGERRVRSSVAALSAIAAEHDDPRCREAAVAALGAIGDPSGLAAVLGRMTDKPTIRRRAVVALSAFEGPEVDAAMESALQDRDWQVRQVAETIRDA